MNKLENQITLRTDEESGEEFYQMPCTILSIDGEEKEELNTNDTPYRKAKVQFININDEIKTSTAITYSVTDEHIEVFDKAIEEETQMLLESREDEDDGVWYLKVSPLIFGSQVSKDDFVKADTPKATTKPVVKKVEPEAEVAKLSTSLQRIVNKAKKDGKLTARQQTALDKAIDEDLISDDDLDAIDDAMAKLENQA